MTTELIMTGSREAAEYIDYLRKLFVYGFSSDMVGISGSVFNAVCIWNEILRTLKKELKAKHPDLHLDHTNIACEPGIFDQPIMNNMSRFKKELQRAPLNFLGIHSQMGLRERDPFHDLKNLFEYLFCVFAEDRVVQPHVALKVLAEAKEKDGQRRHVLIHENKAREIIQQLRDGTYKHTIPAGSILAIETDAKFGANESTIQTIIELRTLLAQKNIDCVVVGCFDILHVLRGMGASGYEQLPNLNKDVSKSTLENYWHRTILAFKSFVRAVGPCLIHLPLGTNRDSLPAQLQGTGKLGAFLALADELGCFITFEFQAHGLPGLLGSTEDEILAQLKAWEIGLTPRDVEQTRAQRKVKPVTKTPAPVQKTVVNIFTRQVVTFRRVKPKHRAQLHS